ncbi:hypothetical protein U1Q18_052067 [Sarracenia purpurea var. burkii]
MQQQAGRSFRGVPFGLYGHSIDTGRRVVVHEFPFRDTPYAEDLGQRARGFSLDMFVVGDDVAANRMPSGKRSNRKGRDAGPSLSRDADRSGHGIHGQRILFPLSGRELQRRATLRAGSQAAAIDTSSPSANQAMAELVTSTVSEVQVAAKRAAKPSAIVNVSDRAAAINAMSAYVRDLSTVVGLLNSPDLMSFVLADGVFRLSTLGMSSLQSFRAYQRLLWSLNGLFSALNYPTTLAGVTMLANAATGGTFVYTSVVSSAATAAVDASFGTLEEALATRQQLAEMFDLAQEGVSDVTLFGQLQDLRGIYPDADPATGRGSSQYRPDQAPAVPPLAGGRS